MIGERHLDKQEHLRSVELISKPFGGIAGKSF